jgi:hypothetical protein
MKVNEKFTEKDGLFFGEVVYLNKKTRRLDHGTDMHA